MLPVLRKSAMTSPLIRMAIFSHALPPMAQHALVGLDLDRTDLIAKPSVRWLFRLNDIYSRLLAATKFQTISIYFLKGLIAAPNRRALSNHLPWNRTAAAAGPNGGVTATETGALATACRTFAVVNENIAVKGGEFQLAQADIQGISGLNLSNPDLEEEKADSWPVGAVINPRSIDALRNLTMTVDYHNIDVSNVTDAPGQVFTLD